VPDSLRHPERWSIAINKAKSLRYFEKLFALSLLHISISDDSYRHRCYAVATKLRMGQERSSRSRIKIFSDDATRCYVRSASFSVSPRKFVMNHREQRRHRSRLRVRVRRWSLHVESSENSGLSGIAMGDTRNCNDVVTENGEDAVNGSRRWTL